jgi:hypothetical protein
MVVRSEPAAIDVLIEASSALNDCSARTLEGGDARRALTLGKLSHAIHAVSVAESYDEFASLFDGPDSAEGGYLADVFHSAYEALDTGAVDNAAAELDAFMRSAAGRMRGEAVPA